MNNLPGALLIQLLSTLVRIQSITILKFDLQTDDLLFLYCNFVLVIAEHKKIRHAFYCESKLRTNTN